MDQLYIHTSPPPNPSRKRISLKPDHDPQLKDSSSPFRDPASGIVFPYTPYPQQLKILKHIHLALKTNSNALIQSPTGTGKTLCLLVGCLSYFALTQSPAKIYYFTRTHSQITQIVNELKKTQYDCRVTVLGSRQSMCINPSLDTLKGKMLDKACEQLCSQGSCRYQSGDIQDLGRSRYLDLPTLNLKQLKDLGASKLFCPYYLSKARHEDSELVILTYNYLLNYNLFSKASFNTKDSVIVFDEAHNVDQISQEGCSIELTTTLLCLVVAGLNNEKKVFERWSVEKRSKNIARIEKLYSFCEIVQNIYQALEREKEGRILPGFQAFIGYMNSTLEGSPPPPTHNSFWRLCELGKEVASLLRADSPGALHLDELASCLEDISLVLGSGPQQQNLFEISIIPDPSQTKVLFLCLSSSFIFSKILSRNPKSIILASGTLQPLDYWQHEIGLQFQFKLISQSFITQTHLYSQIVPSYRSKPFDFSYLKRDDHQQIQNLIDFITQICSIIPNGVVVAFSSYEVMSLTLQSCNMMGFGKKLFWESRGCVIDSLMGNYAKEAREGKGALLFMVMRGRLAEGIDFHDELCRGMVIVGVPFPPATDPKLEAKRRFMEGRGRVGESLCNGTDTSLGFERWYLIQASRVVNQAIGRVIRHTKDYGLVFLLDRKYEKGQIMKYLPEWFMRCLRPSFSLHAVAGFLRREKDGVGEQEESRSGRPSRKLLIVDDDKDTINNAKLQASREIPEPGMSTPQKQKQAQSFVPRQDTPTEIRRPRKKFEFLLQKKQSKLVIDEEGGQPTFQKSDSEQRQPLVPSPSPKVSFATTTPQQFLPSLNLTPRTVKMKRKKFVEDIRFKKYDGRELRNEEGGQREGRDQGTGRR